MCDQLLKWSKYVINVAFGLENSYYLHYQRMILSFHLNLQIIWQRVPKNGLSCSQLPQQGGLAWMISKQSFDVKEITVAGSIAFDNNVLHELKESHFTAWQPKP